MNNETQGQREARLVKEAVDLGAPEGAAQQVIASQVEKEHLTDGQIEESMRDANAEGIFDELKALEDK